MQMCVCIEAKPAPCQSAVQQLCISDACTLRNPDSRSLKLYYQAYLERTVAEIWPMPHAIRPTLRITLSMYVAIA